MHRSGPPSVGGGTRHAAHQCWPHSSQAATAMLGPVLRAVHHPSRPSLPPGCPSTTHPSPWSTDGPHRSRLVECSAGGRAPLIDRYALPEIADLFTDEARFRTWLEVEILATEAWAKLGVVPAADAAAIRERADFTVEADPRAGAPSPSTRRRLRRRRPGAHRWPRRPSGCTTASRPTTSSTPACRSPWCAPATSILGQVDRARGRHHRPGPRAPRHPHGRAHPRRSTPSPPRSAASSRSGRCSSAATASASPGPGSGRGRQALRRGRHVLQRRSAGRGVRVRAARAASGTVHPGDRPRPSRRVALRVRGAGLLDRVVRPRDPPPAAHRGGRGGGAVRGGRAEGFERDAAQAQPGGAPSSSAGWRACCAATSRPGSKTSRSGTSATCRTRRSSASSSPTRSMLAYYMTGEVPRHRRRAASCTPSGCARTSTRRTASCSAKPVLLALVESGIDPRRRLPPGAAQRRRARGRRAGPFLDVLARRPRRHRAPARRRAPRRVLRPHRRARQRRPHVRRRSTRRSRLDEPVREQRRRSRTTTPARCASSTRSTTTACSSSRPTASRCSTSCSPTSSPTRAACSPRCRRSGSSRRQHLAPNHLVSSDPTDFPETAGADVAGRAMLVRAAQPVRLECVARGYLFGSAWSDYQETGIGAWAARSRPGCAQAERLPEPIFTPTTKADAGPRPPARRRRRRRARRRRASTSSCATSRCAVYAFGAAARGDARPDPRRHQARVRRRRRRPPRDRRDAHARLVALLGGRRLPGRDVAAVVRQAVRARPLPLDRLGPASRRCRTCRPRVIAGTRARYVEAYEQVSGLSFDDLVRRRVDDDTRSGSTSRTCPACSTRRARRGARAPGARLRQRQRGLDRQDDPPRARRRLGRGRARAGRRDVPAAAREPGHRAVHGRDHGAVARMSGEP